MDFAKCIRQGSKTSVFYTPAMGNFLYWFGWGRGADLAKSPTTLDALSGARNALLGMTDDEINALYAQYLIEKEN